MALSKLTYNSLNVTAAASKAVGFDSGADDLAASLSGGSMVFIKKLTSDGSDDDLSFVNGASDVVLDSTYKEYMFIFKNIHPETDQAYFSVGFRDGGSDYDATKTTTVFEAYHSEADTHAAMAYVGGADLAQATGFQNIGAASGNDNDDNLGGYLHLFNPSSTTFVKHWISNISFNHHTGLPMQVNWNVAGYCNVTAAIDGVQFKMSTGEIQGGTISLYGIS